MRVYLPITLAALGSALVAGQLGPAPLTGFAVTPALREWYSTGELEELEYVAMMQAARASLRMLHLDTKSGHVDATDAAPDIEAAAAALPAADAGDGDAQFIVDSAEGHELLWYAAQELIYLIG